MKRANLVVALLLVSVSAQAQAVGSAKVSLPILLKVLTYDQTFDSRGSGPFTVVVASEPGLQGQRETLVEELKALPITTIKSRPLRFVGVEFTDEKGLTSELGKWRADAVLAVPGLSTAGVKTISQAAESRRTYSLALDPTMVEQALSLGVGLVAGKPQIVISERASKAIGVRFEASVLKLARIVP